MKKIILLTFLFLGVIIHAQIGNYEVTSPELNIRELPDKNSQVIGKFARNQIVQVEEIEGNWAKVSFVDENGNDKIGYASMKFLIPAEEIIQAQKGSYEVTASELNIRELPDKNSLAIGKFAKNQIVQVEEIEGNWAKVSFVDENGNDKIGYASMKFLIPAEEIKKSNKDKTLLYTISILGLVTLIFYIIALIKTRNGEMTTIVNWYDFFLLCASFIFPVIGVILGLQEEENGPGNLGIAGIVLGGLCFIGSAVWSVMENRDNYFHAFLSVMAKVFIVIVMIVVIFIILHNSIRQTKKTVNGRSVSLSVYEQRAHDNNRARNIAMATSVAGFLVLSLIGSHKG